MVQKHFIDIQNLREEDTELRPGNAQAFNPGDIIQITEKFDGSNACASWDEEKGELTAFSRKQELTYSNTLGGFWNFVQNLNESDAVYIFKEHPNYRVFGEWSNKNKIIYRDTGKIKHWYVYDIWDTEARQWLTQSKVKDFCNEAKLEYIHVLYEGPFVSWEHCRSFMNSPEYGDRQEGIVVKNQSGLASWDDNCSRAPLYLKIVNTDFAESMKTKEKIIDPEKESAKAAAKEIMESICTRNRVEKMITKLRDEGILPENITPEDMKTVARNLPQRVYEDLVKEENELLKQCGEYGGKMCSAITMSIAKEVILGN